MIMKRLAVFVISLCFCGATLAVGDESLSENPTVKAIVGKSLRGEIPPPEAGRPGRPVQLTIIRVEAGGGVSLKGMISSIQAGPQMRDMKPPQPVPTSGRAEIEGGVLKITLPNGWVMTSVAEGNMVVKTKAGKEFTLK